MGEDKFNYAQFFAHQLLKLLHDVLVYEPKYDMTGMWLAIICVIWNYKNKIVFKNRIMDANDIFNLAQLKGWWWNKYIVKQVNLTIGIDTYTLCNVWRYDAKSKGSKRCKSRVIRLVGTSVVGCGGVCGWVVDLVSG